MLDACGGDYDVAARSLGIWPGQAYLVATGLPADGGDTSDESDRQRTGALNGSTQHLVSRHVSAHNPTAHPEVHRWIRARVDADPAMRRAGRRATAEEETP